MNRLTPLIEIPFDAEATFKSRPNRFLGLVDIISYQVTNNIKVHIHDPGRLTDLLYAGSKVLLRKAKTTNRKTAWDLVAANYNGNWILTHSGFHRQIMECIIHDLSIRI